MRPQDLGIGTLFETVRDAVIVADAHTGRIVLWNPAATQIFGYPASEALEMDVEELVPERLRERHRAGLARYRETGHGPYIDSRVLLELPAVRKTGDEILIEMSLNPIEPIYGYGDEERRFVLAIVRDITERKRTEEEVGRLNEELENRVRERTARLQTALAELGASEERHRLLVDSVEDYAIFMVDPNGRVLDWNVGAERVFGYQEEEIVGEPGSLLFTPEDLRLGVPERELRDAREEGRSEDERWHVRKDGTRFWASGIVAAVRDGEGNLRGFAKVARDVTQRRRSEEALRLLAETGAALSFSLDHRETLATVASLAVPGLADWCAVDVLAEDGSVERLAVEHEDPGKIALALKLQDRYPSDPDAPSGVPNVLRTGRSEFYPEITADMLEVAARDETHLEILREIGFSSAIIVPMIARERTLGAIILVSAESQRRYGEADLELAEELARQAALAVDNARLYKEAQKEIAERRWAQDELRRSRDQLEIVLRGVTDGITAQDPTGRVIYANEAAAAMIGYPSAQAFVEAPMQEVMRKFELLDEEGRPLPPERLPGRRALQGEEGAEEVLRFRLLETGEERWSIVTATPIFDQQGEVRMAVNIFRDITEQRRTEDAFREIREAERRRIARDLHDSVLQDLSYTAAAMGMIMLDVEGTGVDEELQRAIDTVRRATQGLRGVVDDLRLEEERDRPFPELMESLLQRNRVMAQGCEISLEMGEGVPSASLGETGTQVLRIIQEALTNARRHSGAESVSVALKLEGSELVAEVSDEGRGFEPRSASGVGLSSMRERAAAVGGKLEIESSVGRGTRLHLRIPMPPEG